MLAEAHVLETSDTDSLHASNHVPLLELEELEELVDAESDELDEGWEPAALHTHANAQRSLKKQVSQVLACFNVNWHCHGTHQSVETTIGGFMICPPKKRPFSFYTRCVEAMHNHATGPVDSDKQLPKQIESLGLSFGLG